MIDTYELVCHLCALNSESEYEYDDLEQGIYDKYGVELEQFDANAIDKAYILDGYSLTDAQRVAVEAQ